MGRNSPYVVTPEAFAELKREMLQARHEITSLRRHLQHTSVRRHQSLWMPPSNIQAYVKNNTASTVEKYRPLAISGSDGTPTTTDETPVLSGTTYSDASPRERQSNSPNYLGRIAIAQEDIAAGETGRCVVAGVTRAYVHKAIVAHDYADLAEDNTALESSYAGPVHILGASIGAGDTGIAYVVLSGIPDRHQGVWGDAGISAGSITSSFADAGWNNLGGNIHGLVFGTSPVVVESLFDGDIYVEVVASMVVTHSSGTGSAHCELRASGSGTAGMSVGANSAKCAVSNTDTTATATAVGVFVFRAAGEQLTLQARNLQDGSVDASVAINFTLRPIRSTF